MRIVELKSLSAAEEADLLALMRELNPEIPVTAELLRNAAGAAGTHLFAVVSDDGHLVGTASLCVYDSPTGRKASIEDVVVLQAYRGRHLGRDLMTHLIDYARTHLGDVDLHLTSQPKRGAANGLYRSLGFIQRETNVYKMSIQH